VEEQSPIAHAARIPVGSHAAAKTSAIP
jgi:hypothetical protein